MPRETLNGAGPWTFESDEDLEPGEAWVLDFRNMKYNGRKRWFKQYLPLDDLQVTNTDTGNSVGVEINDSYESRVLPNAVETYNDEGIVNAVIRNKGGSTIATGDLVVEVSKSAFGADQAAREQASRPVIERAVRDVIPGL